jgi:hypothetical protein
MTIWQHIETKDLFHAEHTQIETAGGETQPSPGTQAFCSLAFLGGDSLKEVLDHGSQRARKKMEGSKLTK